MHGVFRVERRTAARKSQLFTRFWRNLSVISLLLKEFRRLNAIFIAFYTPNVVHGVFSFEISTAARKSQTCTRFWRSQSVISLLLEIFRRSIAIYIAFYTPNVVHAFLSFETSTAARTSLSFTRFWRKLSVISLLLMIFRSLDSIFIAFYSPNVVHAVYSAETSTVARKSHPFARFLRKLRVISLLLEISRRLNAIFARFYTTNAMHACSINEAGPTARKMQSFTRFWRKVGVISLLL